MRFEPQIRSPYFQFHFPSFFFSFGSQIHFCKLEEGYRSTGWGGEWFFQWLSLHVPPGTTQSESLC